MTPTEKPGSEPAAITGLFVYPIKGCSGISLTEMETTVRGPKRDRWWMVVDSTGKFLSQREHPIMATVTTALSENQLTVGHRTCGELELPLELDVQSNRVVATSTVTIWKHSCTAHDEGDEAADWFSSVLGREARLVRFDTGHIRPVDPEYAFDSGANTAFADGFPYLIISQSSLDELNTRLDTPLPMNRFRPNIVINGISPFREEGRINLTAGNGVSLSTVKPCTRCVVTTVDQASGEKCGPEPLSTLAQFKRRPDGKGVTFGGNAILDSGAGLKLRIGDPLTIRGIS